jgi:hypothetical protein
MNERALLYLVEGELPPGGETEPRRGLRGLDVCNGNQSTTISAVRISTAEYTQDVIGWHCARACQAASPTHFRT